MPQQYGLFPVCLVTSFIFPNRLCVLLKTLRQQVIIGLVLIFVIAYRNSYVATMYRLVLVVAPKWCECDSCGDCSSALSSVFIRPGCLPDSDAPAKNFWGYYEPIYFQSGTHSFSLLLWWSDGAWWLGWLSQSMAYSCILSHLRQVQFNVIIAKPAVIVNQSTIDGNH